MVYKEDRVKNFIWHAKTVYNLGFDPVRVLIWEGLYQDKTKLAFWWDLLEIIQERERLLKQRIKERIYHRYIENKLWPNYKTNDS